MANQQSTSIMLQKMGGASKPKSSVTPTNHADLDNDDPAPVLQFMPNETMQHVLNNILGPKSEKSHSPMDD